ncbi:MAG: TonB-dependent receptor, partial [Bacteroidales bacterium]|nr:TonB-dependent receptor [Bacteroidales bacterium]
MRVLASVAFGLLGAVMAAQQPGRAEVLRHVQDDTVAHPDTLRASVVSSAAGSLVVPQRISAERLQSVSGLSEAVRRFTGVQIRDYGGVGGLKTVNVRSLGSEHTGVYVDGIQIDNAQNMQVDLGRLGLDGLASVTLFSGQKVSPLQSAKEYSSASALYLESDGHVFRDDKRDNLKAGLGGGSFLTAAPSLTWEHLLRSGTSVRLSTDAVSSKGEYRFHVKDFRQYPDGTVAGYDTTMTRVNCDLASVRAEAMLFSPAGGDASWNVKAYFYGSGRGLPGPVYKKAGAYPLSLDRQTDRDAFLQGHYQRSMGNVWSVAGRAKVSFNHLEYTDFPESLPEGSPASYNYRGHSAYLSASLMARVSSFLKVNLAQDFQYDYLDADLRGFAYPGRLSSWTGASARFGSGPLEVSATMLYLRVTDTFLSGSGRERARRDVVMPSLVGRWRVSDRFTVNGFAKRSYRMPTFNDLYYTVTGSKTLDPEDAVQFDLGSDWVALKAGGHNLAVRTEIYRNQLMNKIIAVPTSNQFRWSMYNLGKVAVLGADLSADYSLRAAGGEWGAIARYKFQRAKDRSDREAVTWGGPIAYITFHIGCVNRFWEL